MSNLAKRMSVAIASLAVAGGAVLGAGSTASAATATPERAQLPAVSVGTNDHRWGGGDRNDRWGADHEHGRRHGGDRDEESRYSDDAYGTSR
ncbi:hypothetical protein [Streptomyces sp. NPDC050564]|uniref:hypothetical protein n=1 Tax=Streptomyces sp. NPDC050564 TaxID=3365631 RepID=UPI0037A3A19D